MDANIIVFCVDGSLDLSLLIVEGWIGIIDRRERCELTNFKLVTFIYGEYFAKVRTVGCLCFKNEKHTSFERVYNLLYQQYCRWITR